MGGVSMAFPRWQQDPWLYRDRVFKGRILDIGGAGDPISTHRTYFTEATHWAIWDIQPVANYGTPDEYIRADGHIITGQWDTVFSSHTLEHMRDHEAALTAWWNALTPGGYLVLILPSWYTYEREVWPPRFNTDHKTAWTLGNEVIEFPHVPLVSLVELTLSLPRSKLIRATTLDKGFYPGHVDQTADGQCESGLEVIAQKAQG